MRSILLVTLSCFSLCSAVPVAAQSHFSVSGLMGPGDQRAIGVNKLSPGEQEALETWINLWTMKTIEHVLSKRCKCTADECLNSLYDEVSGGGSAEPPRTNADKVQRSSSYQNFSGGDDGGGRYNTNQGASFDTNQRDSYSPRGGTKASQVEEQAYQLISNVQRNGGLIQLEDGSSWEVTPPDQAQAARWHRRDKVQVIPGTNYGDYTLKNLTNNQSVGVKHPGQALRLDPFLGDTYRKAITKNVRENVNNGATIILDDGSVFEIRLADRSSVTKNWGPGTIVQITKKGGMYPYSLKAAQNGDTAEAKLQ